MPRPTVSGTVIRQIYMHHSSAGKNKDYRITVSQETDGLYRVYAEHGPVNRLRQGHEQTKRPVFMGEAISMAESMRDKKIGQSDSYQVVRDQVFASSADNPAPAPESKPVVKPRARVAAESLSLASRAKLSFIF